MWWRHIFKLTAWNVLERWGWLWNIQADCMERTGTLRLTVEHSSWLYGTYWNCGTFKLTVWSILELWNIQADCMEHTGAFSVLLANTCGILRTVDVCVCACERAECVSLGCVWRSSVLARFYWQHFIFDIWVQMTSKQLKPILRNLQYFCLLRHTHSWRVSYDVKSRACCCLVSEISARNLQFC